MSTMPPVKKTIIVFLFISLSFITTAQKRTPFFIEVKAGLSVPTGEFSNKNYGKDFSGHTDGLAKTGLCTGIEGGYQFNKFIAGVLSFGYSTNKQDAASFDEYLKNTYGNNTTTTITTNAWNIFKIMGGGKFNLLFSKQSKLSLEINMQAGICKTAIPAYKYSFVSGTLPTSQAGSMTSAKTSWPWAFCYSFGTGLQYDLNKKTYLLAEAVYFNSMATYQYSLFTFDPGTSTVMPVMAEKKLQLSSLQTSVGVGFRF